ncbi:oxidoreductase [Phaeocystidibacter marisrubri]|nr:oxidoreductase [Phaeocystidibacter marisrubri]
MYIWHMQNSTRVYWITGASSGIGEATALQLACVGHKVILSARRADELKRVMGLCPNPNNIAVVPLNLSEHEKASEWAKAAISAFGHIDVVISNGGIGQFGAVEDNSWEVEKTIIDINLLGTMALVRSVLPHMLERKSGKIVGIASIAGKFGQRNLAAYSASKAGVILWMESLREEVFNRGISVQVISPGFIQTNVTLNSLNASGQKLGVNSKAQENGMPAEEFARKLMKVIRGDKFHHYIGRRELLAIPIHTFARGLLYKLLRRSYR